MTTSIAPRDRVIVALDLPTVDAASRMVEQIGDAAGFYKIGLELAYGGGMDLARRLIRDGKQVFLDLKFHDIPNTVARATAQVADLGASFLTIHAYPQTMRAAREALSGSGLKLLAVTVLTSCDDADLREAGFAFGVRDLVERRARQAREAGVDGLVLSAREAADIRPLVGPDLLLVTPGIRPADGEIGDQKRVVTPAAAVAAGADYLVIGRPITQAADPAAAARAIVAELAAARG